MYRAELHNTVDQPWTAIPAIRVGRAPTGIETPRIYVTVERDGIPFARIDAWPLWNEPFTQALAWKHIIVLGMEEDVYLIDPVTQEANGIACDGYFGHVYPLEDKLLIADSSRLICINERGEHPWKSDTLGIDGVMLDDVRDGIIAGRGEWDPPGSWKPFRLTLASGKPADA